MVDVVPGQDHDWPGLQSTKSFESHHHDHFRLDSAGVSFDSVPFRICSDRSANLTAVEHDKGGKNVIHPFTRNWSIDWHDFSCGFVAGGSSFQNLTD